MRGIIISVLSLALAACATPEQSSSVQQPVEAPLTVGVGDVVLQISKASDLPNAFGGADIFGRTKDEGGVEVRFGGVEDGQLVFLRRDIQRSSDETTITRSPFIAVPNTTYSTGSTTGVIGSTPYSAMGQSSSTTTTYLPTRRPNVDVTDTGWMQIPVDASPGAQLLVEGNVIEVLEVSGNVLTYKITR